jgi:pyruvate dehydrogenase E2 component (dihydrolipoamide acetyltransferase)
MVNSTDVTMPQLGETVSEGTITRWLKQVGEMVRFDEPLLEVSTDKVDTEIPSPADGLLDEILIGEDMTVPVGTILARLRSAVAEAEPSPTTSPSVAAATTSPPLVAAATAPQTTLSSSASVQSPAALAAMSPPVRVATTTVAGAPRHRYSPLIRRLAGEFGVDPTAVTGSGRNGRITRTDLRMAAGRNTSYPSPVEEIRPAPGPESGARSATTNELSTTLVAEVDVSSLINAPAGQGDSASDVLAYLARAVLDAGAGFPSLMSSNGSDYRLAGVHLGVSISGGKTIVLPHANDLSLAGLTRQLEGLADGSGSGGARPGSQAADSAMLPSFAIISFGGTATLFGSRNIGESGVPVLGLGAVTRRPVVVADGAGGEALAVRPMAYLSLTYSERVATADEATGFLSSVKARLESSAR